jgi:uncharacterized protein YjbJ (UPF0337 family)
MAQTPHIRFNAGRCLLRGFGAGEKKQGHGCVRGSHRRSATRLPVTGSLATTLAGDQEYRFCAAPTVQYWPLSSWNAGGTFPNSGRSAQDSKWRLSMDKDRIKGSAEQVKGKIKEVAGKVTGDSKLEGEGKADQVKGKIQNTVGGIKDTVRGK